MAAFQEMPLDSGQRETFPNQFLHPVLFLEQLYPLGSEVCKPPALGKQTNKQHDTQKYQKTKPKKPKPCLTRFVLEQKQA